MKFGLMLKDLAVTFCVGWAFGALVMWVWFIENGLIRSREEWYDLREQAHAVKRKKEDS